MHEEIAEQLLEEMIRDCAVSVAYEPVKGTTALADQGADGEFGASPVEGVDTSHLTNLASPLLIQMTPHKRTVWHYTLKPANVRVMNPYSLFSPASHKSNDPTPNVWDCYPSARKPDTLNPEKPKP